MSCFICQAKGMTTIRRTFVILILLAIVFFIYRGINPTWADALLTKIKGLPQLVMTMTSGSLASGAGDAWALVTGTVLTGTTGLWDDEASTWLLQDISSTWGSLSIVQTEKSGGILRKVEEIWGSTSVTTTKPVVKSSTPSSSVKWLTSKEVQDTQKVLNLFQ